MRNVLASSSWPSALIVMVIIIAGSILSGLHDAIPAWFEVLAAGALGHTITASGVSIGKTPNGTASSPSPPPPPPAAGARP